MTYYDRPKRIEKLSKREIIDLTFDLINAFRLVKTPLDTALLIQDLLTVNEVKMLAKRLRIAKLLLEGKTQKEIVKNLGCSSATVTKIGFWLDQGGDGLKQVISKLPKRYKMPKKLPRRPIEFQLPQVLYAVAQESLHIRQQKQISKVGDLYKSLDSKRVMDKALKEMFDLDYIEKKHKRKKKMFKKIISKKP